MSKEYNMDDFDKIEKLRQRANVSFSEAGEALRACDGDLLDAMVYLERQGKVSGPEQSSFSTDAAEKPSYENVPEVVTRSRTEDPDPSFGSQLGHLIKTALKKSTENFIVISHKGEEKARLPILVLVLALCFFNVAALVAIIVSLFFDVRYRFEGKDDLSSVNKMMDQAENKATTWMNENNAKRQAAKETAKEDAQKRADEARQKAYESSAKAKETARREAEYAMLKAEEARRKAAREKQANNSEPLKTFSEKEVEELAEKYDKQTSDKESNDNDNK